MEKATCELLFLYKITTASTFTSFIHHFCTGFYYFLFFHIILHFYSFFNYTFLIILLPELLSQVFNFEGMKQNTHYIKGNQSKCSQCALQAVATGTVNLIIQI